MSSTNFELKPVFTKKIIKLFIAQPMSGIDDSIVYAKRYEAIKDAIKLIYEETGGNEETMSIYTIPTFVPMDTNVKVKCDHLWMLGRSIQMLADADYIYFTDDWKNARGCKIEHKCAEMYGVKILKD